MQQNRFLFFAIIGVAIIGVIIMIVARQFFSDSLVQVGPTVAIQVVVAPSLEPWAEQAAQTFNETNSNTQVTIVTARSLLVDNEFSGSLQTQPPAAWLAESTFIVDMARTNGLQFDTVGSVAQTSMAWGAFTDKEADFTQNYGSLSWEGANAKATSGDFLTVVMAAPDSSAEAVAALISATAAHLGKQSLSGADVSSANGWLTETFKDNIRTPPRPAEAFATATGRSIGDAGILSQAAWRQAGLQGNADFSITPAQPNVVLDYPFAVWAGSQSTPDAQQAAQSFYQHLLSQSEQSKLANFSLEKAGDNFSTVQTDGQAGLALLRFAEQIAP
ncbi:MAG: hypothetical protein AAF485_25560 [Chloroflexota bacterium]